MYLSKWFPSISFKPSIPVSNTSSKFMFWSSITLVDKEETSVDFWNRLCSQVKKWKLLNLKNFFSVLPLLVLRAVLFRKDTAHQFFHCFDYLNTGWRWVNYCNLDNCVTVIPLPPVKHLCYSITSKPVLWLCHSTLQSKVKLKFIVIM